MASLVLSGDTSGSVTIAAPAVAGSTTQTLVNVTGTLAPVVSGTAITLTNQTAPDFTNIPSWVKRITVVIQGMSTNSTGNPLIQLGTGATPTYATSGYLGSSSGGGNGSTLIAANFTTGIGIAPAVAATTILHGGITIANVTGNNWVAFGAIGSSNNTNAYTVGSSISLGATLTAIRLFIDGTQQFDAGTINIIYE